MRASRTADTCFRRRALERARTRLKANARLEGQTTLQKRVASRWLGEQLELAFHPAFKRWVLGRWWAHRWRLMLLLVGWRRHITLAAAKRAKLADMRKLVRIFRLWMTFQSFRRYLRWAWYERPVIASRQATNRKLADSRYRHSAYKTAIKIWVEYFALVRAAEAAKRTPLTEATAETLDLDHDNQTMAGPIAPWASEQPKLSRGASSELSFVGADGPSDEDLPAPKSHRPPPRPPSTKAPTPPAKPAEIKVRRPIKHLKPAVPRSPRSARPPPEPTPPSRPRTPVRLKGTTPRMRRPPPPMSARAPPAPAPEPAPLPQPTSARPWAQPPHRPAPQRVDALSRRPLARTYPRPDRHSEEAASQRLLTRTYGDWQSAPPDLLEMHRQLYRRSRQPSRDDVGFSLAMTAPVPASAPLEVDQMEEKPLPAYGLPPSRVPSRPPSRAQSRAPSRRVSRETPIVMPQSAREAFFQF